MQEYRRAKERLQGLARGTPHFYSKYNFEGGGIGYKKRIAGIELDALWDKLVRQSLGVTNLDQAEELAREADSYWRARYGENPNSWQKIFALSQLRSASIYQMVGRTIEAGSNFASANVLIEKLAKDRNQELVQLAQILAGHAGSGQTASEALRALDAAYLTHAISAITRASDQTNYSFPTDLFAAAEFKELAKNEGYQAAINSWKTRSDQQTNLLARTMSTADLDAIRYAMSDKKKIRFKGTISDSGWSPNRKTFFMAFEGANHNDFKVVIRQTQMGGIASKLGGGELERTLYPGVTIELEDVPSPHDGQLQLDITQPQQVVSVTSQITQPDRNRQIALLQNQRTVADGRTSGVVTSGARSNLISASETDSLRRATNRLTSVLGTVHSVYLSGSIYVIYFQESKINDALRAHISKGKMADFTNALGGDLSAKLTGKVLQIDGYPRVSEQGYVLITVSSPNNMRVDGQPLRQVQTPEWRDGTNSLQVFRASEPEAIKAAIGSTAIVEGKISYARWNERKTVFLIEFDNPGFLAAISARNITNILQHLANDPVKDLTGKTAVLKGKLIVYGGVERDYKGWAQIFLTDPEQLEILP